MNLSTPQKPSWRWQLLGYLPLAGFLLGLAGLLIRSRAGGIALLVGGALIVIGGVLLVVNFRGLGTQELMNVRDQQRLQKDLLPFWPTTEDRPPSRIAASFIGIIWVLIGLGSTAAGLSVLSR